MTKRKRPPMQPIKFDRHRIARFQENAVIRALLDAATERGFGLNELHATAWAKPREDWDQFHQLIGYSVSGLPWRQRRTRDEADDVVTKMFQQMSKKR